MEINEINFNYNECVKSYETFGTSHYQNICTNEYTSVPWGIGGWVVATLCVLVIVLMVILAGALIRIIIDY